MPATSKDIVIKVVFETSDRTQKDAKKKVKDLKGEVHDLGKTAIKAAAVIGTAFAAFKGLEGVARFTRDTSRGLADIGRQSKNIGVAAGELQKLRFAAELTRTDFDEVRDVIAETRLKILEEAQAGKEEDLSKLSRLLGIDPKALAKAAPTEIIEAFSQGFRGVDETQATAIAQKLFGEDVGIKILAFLSQDIAKAGRELEDMGGVFSDATIERAEKFDRRMTVLSKRTRVFSERVLVKLLPRAEKFVEFLDDFIAKNDDIIAQRIDEVVERLSPVFDRMLARLPELITLFGQFVELGGKGVDFIMTLVKESGGLETTVKNLALAWTTYKVAMLGTNAEVIKFIGKVPTLVRSLRTLAGPLGVVAAGAAAVGAFASFSERRERLRQVDRDIATGRTPAKQLASAIVGELKADDKLAFARTGSTAELVRFGANIEQAVTKGVELGAEDIARIAQLPLAQLETVLSTGLRRSLVRRGERGSGFTAEEQNRLLSVPERILAERRGIALQQVGNGAGAPGGAPPGETGGGGTRTLDLSKLADKKDKGPRALSFGDVQSFLSGQGFGGLSGVALPNAPVVAANFEIFNIQSVSVENRIEGIPGETARDFTARTDGDILTGLLRATQSITPRTAS